MTVVTSDHILRLVAQALNELDSVTVDVSARRAARIASLLDDSNLAVRLGLELKTLGGAATANADDTRRLMSDPSLWADESGPARQAVEEYLVGRAKSDGSGLINAHALSELDFWIAEYTESATEFAEADPKGWLDAMLEMQQIQERVRHTIGTAA